MGSKGKVFSSFCVKCYLYIVYYVLFCTEKWIVSLLLLHEMAKSKLFVAFVHQKRTLLIFFSAVGGHCSRLIRLLYTVLHVSLSIAS